MNLQAWFNAAWPSRERRSRLAAEYRALAELDNVLADIGLRGSLWNTAPGNLTLFDAGVFEGRRQMALELFRICKTDPALIFSTIEAPRHPGAKG